MHPALLRGLGGFQELGLTGSGREEVLGYWGGARAKPKTILGCAPASFAPNHPRQCSCLTNLIFEPWVVVVGPEPCNPCIPNYIHPACTLEGKLKTKE